MTSHRSDCRRNALMAQITGYEQVNDLFLRWLWMNGATAPHINDAQMQFLNIQNVPRGALNDRWFTWLGWQGFTGSLADRFQQWWCGESGDGSDGGTFPGVTCVNLPLLTDLKAIGNSVYDATFARNSGATVTDHEGIVRTVKVNEARFQGARRVEQLHTSSGWYQDGDCVAVDYSPGVVRVSGTAAGLWGFGQQLEAVIGSSYTESWWIKSNNGQDQIVDIRVGETSGQIAQTVTVTSEWKRFAGTAVRTGSTVPNARFGIQYNPGGGDYDLLVTKIQLEVVTDATNQAPSECLDSDTDYGANVTGVKYFDYANGNSVDGNGVVTEAKGADLTTLDGILIEEESTNGCLSSDDLTQNWGANAPATIDDYQTISTTGGSNVYVVAGVVSGTEYTFSLQLRRTSGTENFILAIGNVDSAPITPTSEWATYTYTAVSGSGGNIQIKFSGSSPMTLQVRNVQVEQKPYATSLIPTSGASATRLADDCQTVWPSGLVNDFVTSAEVIVPAADGATSRRILEASSGSDLHRAYRNLSTDARANYSINVGSGTQILNFDGQLIVGTSQKWQMRKSSTQGGHIWIDGNKSNDGLAGLTADHTDLGAVLGIGANAAATSSWLNGTIKDVSVRCGDLTDWEVTGDPAPLPVFHALDGSADVHTGTGGLTTVWASGGYVWNPATKVYDQVAPNTPVWMGGWLQYYPAALNSITNSGLLNQWTKNNTITTTQDTTGLTGAANEAWTVDDTDAVNASFISNSVAISADTNTQSCVFYVKKDNDETRFPELSLVGSGTTTHAARLQVNTKTGAGVLRSSHASAAFEVNSIGDWWQCIVSVQTNTANTLLFMYMYPARSTILGDSGTGTEQGSIVVGESSLYLNKTIPEVRGLPIIPTAGTAVTMDRTGYSFDIANHDNAQGAWYLEHQLSYDGGIGIAQRLLTCNTTTNGKLFEKRNVGNSYRSNADNASDLNGHNAPAYTTVKGACIYDASAALHVINVDEQYGNEVAYTTFSASGTQIGVCDVAGSNTRAAKIRNIRRYDTDYAVSKQVIKQLMEGRLA